MATEKYSNIKQNARMCEKSEALKYSLRLGKNRRRNKQRRDDVNSG